MNIIFASFWVQKIKVWLDLCWGALALFCVPALIATAVFWTFGGGHGATMTSISSSVHAVRGGFSRIPSDVTLATDSQKIIYRMRLVNLKGKTVYTYPDTQVTDEIPKIDNVVIQVPNEVPKGEYDLYTDVTYAKNPIRTGTIQIKVARIFIDED